MMSVQEYPAKHGYQSAEKAKKYANRSAKRHTAEIIVLSRLFDAILTKEKQALVNALDVPSGTGRMAEFLSERGLVVIKADISNAMVMHDGQQTGRRQGQGVVADIEGNLPFLENSFDLVLCWRFLHHLPSETELTKVLQELARISRKWVVFSFFHPFSFHNLARKVRTAVTCREGCRYARSMSVIDDACRRAGLVFWKKSAQLPYLKDLWAAAYIKKTS